MKNLALLTISVFLFLSLPAQVKQPVYVGDTLGPWSVINFEQPSAYITITPSTQNLWQAGTPQKQFFNQAYSPPNAIVTDLSGFYPAGNQSSFDLCVGEFNSNSVFLYNLFIDFRHKFDTDTLRDGGYISVSWDHRLTWKNILDDTVPGSHFLISPMGGWGGWGNTNLYSNGDSLFNGEHGYSGKSNGWIHSCMAWYMLPVKQPSGFPPDTMFLRFNFISDNIHHDHEGWMIDDIRIFSVDLGSGIGEFMAGMKKAWVGPNPIKADATVTFDRSYDNVQYLLTDLSGREVMQGNKGSCNTFSFNRGQLSAGIYLLKISTGDGYPEVHRIVFQD